MWRRKKIIIAAIAAIVVLAGVLGGVALAQSGDESGSNSDSLLERVVVILNDQGVTITTEQLQDALKQAGEDMRAEARDNRIDAMVENGTITEDEAAQLKEWLDSKPDISLNGGALEEFGAPFGRFFDGRRSFRIGPFPGMFRHEFSAPSSSDTPTN